MLQANNKAIDWNERKLVMKCAILIAVNSVAVCLVGCASPAQVTVAEPVGPAPTPAAITSASSELQVYSARERVPFDPNMEAFRFNNDYGRNDFLYEPAHTDYTIYTKAGKVYERVKNARNYEDPQPAIVTLPPGEYRIMAKARDFGWVTIPVIIEPHKVTMVNLQRSNPVVKSVNRADAVLLGGDRVVGWRETTVAAHP
jgi:hypothetical protein